MAGIIEQFFRPQKTVMQDRRTMELEAAREILAKVFGVKLSEVDEMIENRFQAGDSKREYGLWPREFWLDGGFRLSIRPAIRNHHNHCNLISERPGES
jgi:hypothetical protein